MSLEILKFLAHRRRLIFMMKMRRSLPLALENREATALAKHSAKEEHIERRKVRFDMADYFHLRVGEVFSGYLSQVHSSRDLEVDMVKQMHQKFEA